MVVKGFNPEMQTIIFFLQNNRNKLIKWRHWRLSSDHSVNATYVCTALAEGWGRLFATQYTYFIVMYNNCYHKRFESFDTYAIRRRIS